MIKATINMALRSFQKDKAFTALNIVGLSIGMTASFLIFQYVLNESSFDTFRPRAKDIYRVQYNLWQNGVLNFESAMSVPAVGPALLSNFAEVEEFARLWPVEDVITYETSPAGRIAFRERRVFFADPSVLSMFDIKVLKGDPAKALKEPNKVAISQRAATKYFGDDDPVGKTILKGASDRFEVAGVFEDTPENSHLDLDFLLSYETLGKTYRGYQTSWNWYDFYTYVLVREGTDVDALQKKWDDLVSRLRKEDWTQSSTKQEFLLKPMLDIHLFSNLQYELMPETKRDGDSIYGLGFIGLFILIIAWVNYINLATARAYRRAKEVGVRKAIGADRRQLIGQFIVESIILNFIAAVLVTLLVWFLWPQFVTMSGTAFKFPVLTTVGFWVGILLIFIVGAILSGLYPALLVSSFRPITVLKGAVLKSSGGKWIRKSLVTFQFVASILLASGAIIVYMQLNFMRSHTLGIDIDQVIVINGPGVKDSLFPERLKSFKTEVASIPGVQGAGGASSVPGYVIPWTGDLSRLTGDTKPHVLITHMAMDENYAGLFGLTVIAGRGFGKDYVHDERNILLNREATKALGFKEPEQAVDQLILQETDTVRVVGVLENFNQLSLKTPMEPMAFQFNKSASGFYVVKYNSNQPQEVLAKLESAWKNFFPGNPFEFFVLREFFDNQYGAEIRFQQAFVLFTALAIFISALGLFGLASFIIVQRTKEIGIRKILGSSSSGVALLLAGDFIRPVLVANLVAWPLGWFMMEQWLQSFPYRIEMSVIPFVFGGFFVVITALCSVGSQMVRAYWLKPTESLKYE